MIRACKLLLLCLSVQVFNPVFVFAQSDSATFKFGKITAADFDLSQHSFDTTADAVIIFKNGTVNITALMTRGQIISKRIKILTENGKKVANASIPLYGSQQIKYFKANSYNLEDGKIVTTAMSATDYHFDNESEFKDVIKFTVPNAKVGSIIDIEYATSISLPDWHFQDVHPVLSSTFTLQESLGSDFIAIEQSLINFHSRNKFNKDGSSYGVWVMKNLPAKIKEGLVFDPENFYSKIIFEVSGSNIYASWDAFSDFAIHSTQWYNSFYKKHSFFEKILPVIANESKEDEAKRIYYHVRDNYKKTIEGGLTPKQYPYVIMDKKTGSRSELNLYLVSYLRSKGFNAHPILINTRYNGKPVSALPIFRRLNYTACYLKIDDKEYLLDVSSPILKFNTLPLDCYNGVAHIVHPSSKEINLSPDSVKEVIQTTASYNYDAKNNEWICQYNTQFGFYTSLDIRTRMIRQEEDQVKKLLQKNLKDNVSVRSYSLTKNPADTFLCEQHIECAVQATGSADKIYANLTIGLNAESDAFKTEKRFMPIEFPFTQYNVSSIDLIIPEGYKAEDVPTSMEIVLDNNNGSYNYIVEQTDDKITISTITRVNKAIFSPNEFDVLQKFFNHINTLREQPIVLSKK